MSSEAVAEPAFMVSIILSKAWPGRRTARQMRNNEQRKTCL
jgi:hypothetical protein